MAHDDTKPRLILASASPRRGQLLREAGYEFEQVTPPFDDSHEDITNLSPEQATHELAKEKASSVAHQTMTGLIIGCDTLVALGGRAIGKPATGLEAQQMLHELIGRDHEVVTAVCLLNADTGEHTVFTDTAKVHIGQVDEAELTRYLHSKEWHGKAGGYNLGELKDRWPITVEGDPTTVIGLPMRKLEHALRHFAPGLKK